MELRKAMPVHHTDIADEAWDAGAMLKRMGDNPGTRALRLMHAWVDPEGDPEAKSSYKLPHHMADADGNVGAANLRACVAAMAALNGARGGVNIPEEDRQAVHRHIAAHMMDGDMQPPELKSSRGKVEHRAFPLAGVEIRMSENEPPKIVGHAAVFNALSEDIGFFREKIAPGAFAKTIQEADVRALWNHDPNYVLGRTKSGTLKLAEDDKGLAVEITPPDTQWARDLMETMRRGDVDQMSFGFQVIKEEWEGDANNPVRVLREVKLFDVSPVTFPAYSATDVQVRSLLNILKDYLPKDAWGSADSKNGEDTDKRNASLYRLDILKKRLEIAEKM